jgi:hypothetical protein
MFRPIRPSSGEAITKHKKEGSTDFVTALPDNDLIGRNT